MTIAPFPLIELSGPPFERGVSYGRQAMERIKKGIGHYGAQLANLGLSHDKSVEIIRGFLPKLEAFEPSYLAEMKGIAQGAGVTLEEVVLLNARTEVVALGKRMAAKSADPDGCTGVMLLPEATRDRVVIHCQNWDWKKDCVETGVVLKVRRDDGPDVLTLTEAGGLARAGLNAAGIAVTANYLECDRDYRQIGVPLALVRRKVLDSDNLAHALQVAYCTPKSSANNLMISHAGGIAIDLECAPDETFALHPERGMLVHANHWQSQAALSKLKECGIGWMPDSLYRDTRVRGLLAPDLGGLTRDHVRRALLDDFQTPYAVCRPPLRNPATGTYSATVAMLLMEPAQGLLEIAPLPALNRHFTTYRLEPAAAQAAD